MALNPSLLADTADDILGSVATRLLAHSVEVPDRQYIHAGEVAFDIVGEGCCSQLVVAVEYLDHAMPGEQAAVMQCAPPRHARIHVWLLRCVPTVHDNGTAPTDAELNAAGVDVLTDMWALAYVLWEGYDAEDWGGFCRSVILGLVEAVGPEGGCGGSHATVDIQLM